MVINMEGCVKIYKHHFSRSTEREGRVILGAARCLCDRVFIENHKPSGTERDRPISEFGVCVSFQYNRGALVLTPVVWKTGESGLVNRYYIYCR